VTEYLAVPAPEADTQENATAAAAARPTAESSGPTGHAQVDAALDDMSRAANLAPAEQVGVYESVHGALQETLRTIEEG
jgi:hypothetical protein